MDGASGGDQSGRDRQIHRENDQTTNPRHQRNGDVANQHENGVEVADRRLPATWLTLGTTPPAYSSPIQPTTSLFRPPMNGWASPEFMAPPLYQAPLSLNNFFHPMGSQHPPVNYFPPPTFTAPSNQDPPVNYFPPTLAAPSNQDPPVNYVPPSTFTAPSNQDPTRSTLSLNSGDESLQSTRSQSSGNQKTDTIRPPFPWATNIRGKIQTLEQLESKQITRITGDVQCKHCEKVYQLSYDLRESFIEVGRVFASKKMTMRDRAPKSWTHPEPVNCEFCGREKTVKPVIADRKSKINWLFMLLGQTLGYCTLEQLRYFCKHSKTHRTGAKDRVLYSTYMGLCKMLEPNDDLFQRKGSS